MGLLADEVALLKLKGLWDYGGAANAATGLASLKTAADVGTVAASGAGIMGIDPASIMFSLALKLMGIGPSGSQATPMTPEERELFNTVQKVDMAVDLAQKASTGNFDYEGQGETVEATALDALDAINALPDSELEFFGDTKDKLLQTIQNVPRAIKKVPGALVEGTADLGNVIFQGATLGKGPQLEAVVPNLMDILNGGIGGTLVLGGGQTPTAVLGTGQTGIGRGTKVGVPNIPVIGPVINKVIGMHQQGATLGDIIKSIPAGLYDSLPQILSGAAAAGLLFNEEDKETLVGLGVEPSILGGSDAAVTKIPEGAGGVPAAGAGIPAGTDVTNIIKGTDTAKAVPVLTDTNSATGTATSKAVPVLTDTNSYVTNIIKGTDTSKSVPVIKTGPISDAELDKILTGMGGRPAVAGGYDTPAPEIKTSSPAVASGGGGGGGGGGGSTSSGGQRTVQTNPGELVDIDYLYDIAGSILPPINEEDEDIMPYIYNKGGPVQKFNGFTDSYVESLGGPYPATTGAPQAKGFGSKVVDFLGADKNQNLIGLIGAGLGGLLGMGGSTQSQGSQGYQGGIPDYKATRQLVPNAFSPTITDPITQEVTTRRPGGAGRQYFTDVKYTPTSTTEGGLPAIMGADQIAAQNAAYTKALADQEAENIALANSFLSASGATADAAATAASTAAAAAAATPATTTATTGAGAGVTPPTDLQKFNTFLTPFRGKTLTATDLLALSKSGYNVDQLAAGLEITGGGQTLFNAINSANNLSNAFNASAGEYTANTPAAAVDVAATGGVDAAAATGGVDAGTTTPPVDIVDLLTAGERASVNTGKYTDNGDGTYSDARGNIYNEVDGQLTVDQFYTGQELIDQDINTKYQTAVTGDGDPAYSTEEVDAVGNAVKSGQVDIPTVAEDFGESQLDVITGLLTGGYQTPAQIAATLNAVDPSTEYTEVDLMVSLLKEGKTNVEDIGAYYNQTPEDIRAWLNATYTPADLATFQNKAVGGTINEYYLGGPTDGMADDIPAMIGNSQPAALSDGEFVVPADVVSHLGNGNSDAGAQNLYSMMERVRTDRTGNPNQGKQIDPNQYLA